MKLPCCRLVFYPISVTIDLFFLVLERQLLCSCGLYLNKRIWRNGDPAPLRHLIMCQPCFSFISFFPSSCWWICWSLCWQKRTSISQWADNNLVLLKWSSGTYCQTNKNVNTWNILGIFIVLWPITAKIRTCVQATKPALCRIAIPAFSFLLISAS